MRALAVAITDNSDEIGELMRKIQKHNFDAHGHHYRGTHVSLRAIGIHV